MNRVPHSTWASILGVAYLGLMTNLLVAVFSAPVVLLLITTDPMVSWPLLALAAPLSAPALAAAFATFRAHGEGDTSVVARFVRSWRRMLVKSLALGAAATALLVVLLVDVRMLSDTALAVALVPVLLLLAVIAVGTALVSLVALAEVPAARLRDVVRASVYLALRHWYLTAASLAVVVMQGALFTQAPAVAIGLTAAPALYVAWAGSRFSLRPVLDTADTADGGGAPARRREAAVTA